jgi:hypothetical protein
MEKLNRAGQAIDKAYAKGKLKRLQRAIEALGGFYSRAWRRSRRIGQS